MGTLSDIELELFVKAQKKSIDALRDQVAEMASTLADHNQLLNRRLDAGEHRMALIEGDIRENTKATDTLTESTAELNGWLAAFKGALKTMDLVAKLAKPLGAVLAVVAAALGIWHAVWPKK